MWALCRLDESAQKILQVARGMLASECTLAKSQELAGTQTLAEMLEMLTISRALGGTTLAGSAAFCAVSRDAADAWASTAVAGTWGHLDGIASSRSGSCTSWGVVAWTEYIAHTSGDAENLAAALNCGAKFDSRICGGTPVAAL